MSSSKLRIGLRTKLTLAFIGVTVVPLAVALGLLSQSVEQEFREEQARQLVDAREGISTRLDAVESSLATALDRIAEDSEIDYLRQDLRWGRFYGDQERERQIVRDASRLMTAPQLDVLKIIDAERDGYVIAMGQRRGVEPPDPRAVARARANDARGLWRRERVLLGDETVPMWTVQVARQAGPRLVLAGGRVVDRDLVSALVAGLVGELEIAIRAPDGSVIATTFAEGVPQNVESNYAVEEIVREGAGDAGSVSVVVYLSRAELRRTLASLLQFAGLLAVLGLALSVALGLLFSRAIVRPLRSLVVGAEAVAQGDLDVRIQATTRDEVGDLVDSFNRMGHALTESRQRLLQAERIAAWKDIARQIAHEVKNPLFPIQTSVETLRRAHARQHPRFDEVFDETTRTVLEQVNRLSSIVGEFSRFARMPAPRPVESDLNALAHDTAALFAAGDAGVTIETALDVALPPVWLDPTLFGQVLNNLVKNAVEAARSRVVVRTEALDAGVRLVVEDDGEGVPGDKRADIFEPYVTSKEGGTGLGLAVVQRIVIEHAGRVHVEDAASGGARFVVELPLRPASSIPGDPSLGQQSSSALPSTYKNGGPS